MKKRIFWADKIDLLCAFITAVAVTLMFYISGITVQAEETTEKTYTLMYEEKQEAKGHLYTYIQATYTYTGNIAGYYVNDYAINFYSAPNADAYIELQNSTGIVDEIGNYRAFIDTTSNCRRVGIFDNYQDGEWYKDMLSTDIPLFATKAEMDNYLRTGDTTGQLNKPPRDLDKDGILIPDLEPPRIVTTDTSEDSDYVFYISNATDNLNIQMQGRWYSVDDIELYKDALVWKYKYSSLLKGELTDWLTYEDAESSKGEKDFSKIGAKSFDALLEKYPIDKRTYFGGTNALGNWLFGYNDAYETLTTFLLPNCNSLFNGCEIYVRFWYEDDSGIYFSKWTHWYDGMADPSGSSGSRLDDADNDDEENQSEDGLDDNEKKELEDSGKSKNDTDTKKKYSDNPYGLNEIELEEFNKTLTSLADSLGDFPALFAKVFSFLPDWVIALVSLGIAAIVILRFLGR